MAITEGGVQRSKIEQDLLPSLPSTVLRSALTTEDLALSNKCVHRSTDIKFF